MKICKRCGKQKDADQFRRIPGNRDGLDTKCVPCAREYDRERQPRYRRRSFANKLQLRYGVSFDQWSEMLIGQGGRCAVCCEQLINVHLDHDHSSGQVRGLLCPSCNLAEGHLASNPARARALAEYMEAWAA